MGFKVGGTSMKEVRGASFGKKSIPFLLLLVMMMMFILYRREAKARIADGEYGRLDEEAGKHESSSTYGHSLPYITAWQGGEVMMMLITIFAGD